MGRLSYITGWLRHHHEGLYEKKAERGYGEEKGHAMLEAGIRRTAFEDGGRGHVPRNPGGHQNPKKAKTRTLPLGLAVGTSLANPLTSALKACLGLLTSKKQKGIKCVVLSPDICGNLEAGSSPGKLRLRLKGVTWPRLDSRGGKQTPSLEAAAQSLRKGAHTYGDGKSFWSYFAVCVNISLHSSDFRIIIVIFNIICN